MIQTKSFIYICLLFLLGSTAYSQSKLKKVYMPYREAAVVIDEIPKDDRVSYEEVDILLFETDRLFQGIRYVKVNNVCYYIPEHFLCRDMIRFELLDHAKCLYLLDYGKKVKAVCYPNETNFEVQWFTDGINSALLQWEMNTININRDYDETMMCLF